MSRSHFLAPSRLKAARQFRGLTQKALAEAVGLTPMALSGYESGHYFPASSVVEELAQALNFPPSWFEQDEISLVDSRALSFRCQSRMSARLRDRSSRTWDVAALIAQKLRDDFNLPPVNLPDLSQETPEAAARTLRDEWRLEHEPIEHMVALLESKGVLVFWTDIDSRAVDAYCHWDNDNPLVVLNANARAGERSRFNAAHELGHLVLHQEALYKQQFGDEEEDGETRQSREVEANTFASAFLLPEENYADEAPLQPAPEAFLELKERWMVSVAAMVRRNLDLELFSPSQYERAMTRITLNGWRLTEPEALENEESVVHRQIFEALWAEGSGVEDLAASLHLAPEDLFVLMPIASRFSRPKKGEGKRQFRKPTSSFKNNVLEFPDNRAA